MLLSTPSSGSHHPSSWLLKADPDLRPDQVWMLVLQLDAGFPFRSPVLADTAEQAMAAACYLRGTAQLAISEEDLSRRLGIARSISPSLFLPPPVKDTSVGPTVKRFGFAFFVGSLAQSVADPSPSSWDALVAWPIGPQSDAVLRLVWIDALDEPSARRALSGLGESLPPDGVIDVDALEAMRNELRIVRENRGDGACADGRFLENLEERGYALAIDHLPGGQAELDKNVREIEEMCRRAESIPTAPGNASPFGV